MKKLFGFLAWLILIFGTIWGLNQTGVFDQLANQLQLTTKNEPNNPEARSVIDQDDQIIGFQIKPIVLIPSDVKDNRDDTSGLITKYLNRGNAALRAATGNSFAIDSTANGYDILFIRSKLTLAQFEKQPISPLSVLIDSKLLDEPGLNRKDYVFFIPATTFESGDTCGIATENYPAAIVAYGDRCESQAGMTWVHEVFHTLGVTEHVAAGCDLMNKTGGCGSNFPPIDQEHKYYLGTDKNGVDLLTLRVWLGATGAETKLRADCVVVGIDKKRTVTCPTGEARIGNLEHCWQLIRFASLQEKKDGKWVTIAKGKRSSKPWSSEFSITCSGGSVSPVATVSNLSAGPVEYRWIVNGYADKSFKVHWQN